MLPAYKPGSVEPKLGRSFLWERGHPRPRAAYPQRLCRGGPPLAAYLALLPLGFAVPRMSPPVRWALTPPFHPCLCLANQAIGGLFSVALSVETERLAQALPGSVPYGARTFLECSRTRDHPADSILRKLTSPSSDGGVTLAQ
jgi:hypothetical protein